MPRESERGPALEPALVQGLGLEPALVQGLGLGLGLEPALVLVRGLALVRVLVLVWVQGLALVRALGHTRPANRSQTPKLERWSDTVSVLAFMPPFPKLIDTCLRS
jgi:hypothetical protein